MHDIIIGQTYELLPPEEVGLAFNGTNSERGWTAVVKYQESNRFGHAVYRVHASQGKDSRVYSWWVYAEQLKPLSFSDNHDASDLSIFM